MADRMIPWPEDIPRRYNANSDPCDMWIGPCACGATHFGDHIDWLREYIAVLEKDARKKFDEYVAILHDESAKRLATEDELCTAKELIEVIKERLGRFEETDEDARAIAEWVDSVAAPGSDIRNSAQRVLCGGANRSAAGNGK